MEQVKTLHFKEALQKLELPGLQRNLFSSPDWWLVIFNTYKLDLFIKYLETDGKVRSYIIYSVVKNFLEWKICICSFCDYCDSHVASADDWNLFFASLRDEFPRYRIAIRNLRDPFVAQVKDLDVLSYEKFHILDIRDDLETVWQRTHDSFKSAVKQSEKSGVTVKSCGRNELRKFFDLHLQVRKNKYRLFPQPYRFFECIWDEYMEKGKGILLGAYDPSGKFIAANVYLICGNIFYYKFNTSHKDALKLRPNNLLFWEGIKLAKERGMEYIDLGSSGLHQKGLVLYKDHTGASSLNITHLGYQPEDYQFSDKIILKTMTKIFTYPWMPNFLVRWGSHLIYPYLA